MDYGVGSVAVRSDAVQEEFACVAEEGAAVAGEWCEIEISECKP